MAWCPGAVPYVGILGACGVGRRGALAKPGTVLVRQLCAPRGMGLSGEVGGMTARCLVVSASPLMLFDEMTISIVRFVESCGSDLRSTVGRLFRCWLGRPAQLSKQRRNWRVGLGARTEGVLSNAA